VEALEERWVPCKMNLILTAGSTFRVGDVLISMDLPENVANKISSANKTQGVLGLNTSTAPKGERLTLPVTIENTPDELAPLVGQATNRIIIKVNKDFTVPPDWHTKPREPLHLNLKIGKHLKQNVICLDVLREQHAGLGFGGLGFGGGTGGGTGGGSGGSGGAGFAGV
jgi:hypothetical protein